jgi:hypothetical protein
MIVHSAAMPVAMETADATECAAHEIALIEIPKLGI